MRTEEKPMERIWVAEGAPRGDRAASRSAIEALSLRRMGVRELGLGSDGLAIRGMTGFYFVRTNDASGSGFGATIQLDRLRTGAFGGVEVTA